jgi:hypothetical protein
MLIPRMQTYLSDKMQQVLAKKLFSGKNYESLKYYGFGHFFLSILSRLKKHYIF